MNDTDSGWCATRSLARPRTEDGGADGRDEAKDENDAGFASGYIASAMMLGRLFSSIAWGRAADSIGRKPLLLLGCFSIGTFSLLFGFSSNFIMALSARFLLGFFNPIW